jgi:CubicO group peptidase (beta-lactamase class C family)
MDNVRECLRLSHPSENRTSLAYVFAVIAGLTSTQGAFAQWAVVHGKNSAATASIPPEVGKTLADLRKRGVELRSIAFAPGGGWVVLYDKNGLVARNIPHEAYKTLTERAEQGAQLKSIAFAPGGGWVVLFDKNGLVARGIPDEAFQVLTEQAQHGAELKSIAFAPAGGWVALFNKNNLFARHIPDEAFEKLNEFAKQGAELKSVAFAPGGGWTILFDKNGLFARHIPDDAFQSLTGLQTQGAEIKSLSFFPSPIVHLSKDDRASRDAVLKKMAHHRVAGLGVALLEGGKLAWARGYGVHRAGTKTAVTGHTRFQAASISKPVTALAALRLVQQGKLDLDQSANEELVSWKVPDNSFTRQRQPTLRLLLSHSAGFNVHGFGGYERGAAIPSLVQVLDGKPPANSAAIRVDFVPGSKVQYSGGGYCVVQQMMQDVGGKPFPRLMQELVLKPVGMQYSTFQQPLPKELQVHAATGHDDSGAPLAGAWHVYPEMAAAGLWTTPSDLARFVLALSQAHARGSSELLGADEVKEMFTRQKDDAGLGIFLAGNGQSFSFSHNGANAGFRCQFIGFPATGQGAVLMTNSDNGDRLIGELIESLRIEYHWPG